MISVPSSLSSGEGAGPGGEHAGPVDEYNEAEDAPTMTPPTIRPDQEGEHDPSIGDERLIPDADLVLVAPA